jgi:hypothetical protein
LLTESNLDTQNNSRLEHEAEKRTITQSAPALLMYQQQILRALAQGISWEGGRLPLSFQPSPYQVRVKDSSFFATSALECFQLPFLLGETAHVSAVCPSNGSAIQLTVTTQGLTSQDPPGCVISVAVSGQMALDGCAQLANSLTDPEKLIRQLTRFFSSAEAAALWLVAYPSVQIFELDQAWHLAAELAGRWPWPG